MKGLRWGALGALGICLTNGVAGADPAAEAAPAGGEPALVDRAPPAGKGAVFGAVTDAESREPLLDAAVSVVGTRTTVAADVDGRFRLELSPGVYELRVWFEGHRAKRIQRVEVAPGAVRRLDVALERDAGAAPEVIAVEASVDRASQAALLALRKNAPHVGDAVSAQEIARTPDKNAAEAVRRVVGATVVDNKYVYVRGLGERYTNALLNGTPLPSPEPDRQAVPLDLFPAVLLSDLTIAKTFTPDMPGDFAGGSVRINTRELPDRFLFQATISIGLNTASTFGERLSYVGSSTDWLGIDGGARTLPAEIPSYKVVRFGPKPDGTTLSSDELTAYGQALNSYMSTTRTPSWPNMSGNVVVGDSVKLGGARRLGYAGALLYGRKFTRIVGEKIGTFDVDAADPKHVLQRNDYRAETGLDQVTWGAYGTLTYAFGANDRVRLTGLTSRFSDNEARVITGHNEERDADIEDTRLRFVSRSLTFGKLDGSHRFVDLDGAELAYNVSVSYATSDEPDTRENVYVRDAASGVLAWDRGTLSGSHFFGEQGETAYGGGFDWSQPVRKGALASAVKLGGLFSLKRRDFSARRFHYIPKTGVPSEVFDQRPDQLFTPANIGTALELEEYTKPNDAYTGEQDVFAGYVMADVWLAPALRVVVGGRVESSDQRIHSFDPYAAELTSVNAELSNTDLLPAAAVVVRTTRDSNLRASLTRTVVRPQFRELSPFSYTDYFGAFDVLGNPELQRTSIVNADLRFELFPGAEEVLAVSAFFKQFDLPIEQVIIPSNGQGVITYDNARGAHNAGLELELRKNLAFVAAPLRPFSVLGNLTLVRSRVDLGEDARGIQTNAARPLSGQSPYVVNAALDYVEERTGTRVRLLYNVFGPRIVQVGTNGLDDVYEQPRHMLDLTVAQRFGQHLDLKLAVENILDSPVERTVGHLANGAPGIVDSYKNGTTFSLGATVSN